MAKFYTKYRKGMKKAKSGKYYYPNKRSNGGRASGRSNYKTNVVMYKSPIPPRALTKLRYSTRFLLDPSSTGMVGIDDQSLTSYQFRMNSCFDPDYSSSNQLGNKGDNNHQPFGFDQWASQYDNYTVLGSTITCTFYNQNLSESSSLHVPIPAGPGTVTGTIAEANTSSKAGVFVALHGDRDLVLPDSFDHLVETKACKYISLLPGQKKTLKRGYSLKQFRKLDSNNQEMASYGATVAANPLVPYYMHVIANAITPVGSLDVPSISVHAVMEFIVSFTEAVEVQQS